jgi:hypothetical protein
MVAVMMVRTAGHLMETTASKPDEMDLNSLPYRVGTIRVYGWRGCRLRSEY